MVDTAANTRIARGEWIDLNIVTGIQAGDSLSVQNIGTSDIWYSIGVRPAEENTRYRILRRGEILFVSAGDATVWVRSDVSEGAVNAQELTADTNPQILQQSLACHLPRIAAELELLNARFEEAFPTRINREDVKR